MDSDPTIEHYRQPPLVIIASLYAMIGLAEGGGMIDRLKRPLYRKVHNLLRPAEAAVRRLIIVMAQGLEIEPSAARKRPARSSKGKSRSKAKRRRLFLLFDPLARADAGIARRPIVKVQRPRAAHSLAR